MKPIVAVHPLYNLISTFVGESKIIKFLRRSAIMILPFS